MYLSVSQHYNLKGQKQAKQREVDIATLVVSSLLTSLSTRNTKVQPYIYELKLIDPFEYRYIHNHAKNDAG